MTIQQTEPVDIPNISSAAMIARHLNQIVHGYIDEFLQEPGKFRAQIFTQWIAEFEQGCCRFEHVDEVRVATLPMFLNLVDRNNKQIPDKRVRYRSVSLVPNPKTQEWKCPYFERRFISQIGLQRTVAVAIRSNRCTPDFSLLPVDRIIVVPSDVWIRANEDPEPSAREFWEGIQPKLDEQIDQGTTINCAPAEVLELYGMASEYQDFGLYGNLAVGLYSCEDRREQLALYSANSSTMDVCNAIWLDLLNGPCEVTEWKEMKRRARL